MSAERMPTESEGADEPLSLPRRKFLSQALGLAAGALIPPVMTESWAQEPEGIRRYPEGWFYSPEAIARTYDEEYRGERVLQNIIRYEGGVLRGASHGFEADVPPKFIEQLCAHCFDMLEAGAAAYLFRLDAFHNHLYLPSAVVENTHKDLTSKAASEKAMSDPRLVALYHNYEHTPIPPKGTPEYEVYRKRNVAAYFDGRPIEILPLPEGKRTAAELPMQTVNPDIKFAAHKDGLFSISRKGETIRLDFSLGDHHYF